MKLLNPNQGQITIKIEDPSGYVREVTAQFETDWSDPRLREFAVGQITRTALLKLCERWEFMSPGMPKL